MNTEHAETAPLDSPRPEKRAPRSIRFHGREWERIEAFAEDRGLAAAEFVRFAVLAEIEAAWRRSSSARSTTPT